jgi:hypothetical protein
MPAFGELCNDPRPHVAGILAEWEAARRADAAWPESARLDRRAAVVAAAVLDAALCRPAEPASVAGNVSASAAYGEARREQGVADDVVRADYALLRAAVWRHLTREGQLHALDTVLRVDAALATSGRAALIGFHRAELEADGEWLAALADEVPHALAGRAPPP